MSYEITYKSKWSGKKEVHVNTNNEADARGWTEYLAKENNCKAVCERVENNQRRHIVSEGND